MDWSLFEVLDDVLVNLQQELEGLEWEGQEGVSVEKVQSQIDRLRHLQREGAVLLPRF